jgi:hypothetical protein
VLAIMAITMFAAGQSLVLVVEGMRPLILCTTLSVALAAIQLGFRRRSEPEEADAGFREIVLFLIGAQEGRGRLMDEKLAIAEVIAAVQGASRQAEEAAASAPGDAEPVTRTDHALRREAVGAE